MGKMLAFERKSTPLEEALWPQRNAIYIEAPRRRGTWLVGFCCGAIAMGLVVSFALVLL